MIKYVILNLEPSNDKIQCSLQIKYLSTNPLRALIFDWSIQRFYNFLCGEKFKLDYPTELINKYNNWNSKYKQFQKLGLNPSSANEDLDRCAKQLDRNLEQFNQELNNWLESVPNKVKEKIEKNFLSSLEKFLDSDTKVIFVIETEILEIQKLFWHHWKLLKNHPEISLIFGITQPKNKAKQELYVRPSNRTLEVLIIFGDIPEGNIQKQKNIWEKSISICHNLGIKLELHYLEKISSQKIRSLVDNGHQFEVIYFLGHNPYEEEGNGQEDNNIQISEYEYWPNSRFCECINIQKIKTLKLVILDSCYSLKLAKALINEAEIPQVIATRESIFLDFSREFLVVLLIDLLRYKFLPFALKEAQEKIEDNEDDKKWQSSASVVALLQNLNKTPWTWPNNKESRFKKYCLVFLFGFAIGLISIKSIFMNISITRRLFPPSKAEVENVLQESTVTIKVYDPKTNSSSLFAGIIFAYDKKAEKSHSQQDTTYYILTTAKSLENRENSQIVILTNQGRKEFRNYRPITEVSQHLAIMTFNSNKTYKIAQLSKAKAALEEKVYMAARQSPEDSHSNLNLIDGKITDLNPMQQNQTYKFFYDSFDGTIKPKADGNSIINQYGCLIGIDLGSPNLPNQNLGIGIPENTLLEVKKLKNPQDTSINNIKESKFADLYTESCQYE
ncbi:MAG: hypothetical protein IM550_04870 [Microcystis sp. M54BS1]|uniref:hypothetical protein n=1 Tax=unclassified Microcystis TaxID=2643300 RepID=UPI00257DFAD1|nr:MULTISPECIES: hypothetical protein [unclassified Microcystis]MCA2538588.1 hypothetical protein [Microcystis sp. M54BS1]MCA2597232.1 hypothetical protein [Microcystis sp. M38BS1]MCA2610163.1 hypothetical protein [Microcystis sp. M27BS1]MCA2508062.1 hypothetical protein [Microcystis sp. M62BS1]MCA2512001.1 hypothetical protein [Microcystis sp. M60BS1]